MEILASKLAASVKRASPETSSFEVLKYSLLIYLNTAFIVLASLVIGWIDGHFSSTVLSLFVVAVIRFFSGGEHFQSSKVCILVSVTVCTGIPYISYFLNYQLLVLLNTLSAALILIFSPRPGKNAQLSLTCYPLFKTISFFLVCLNFWISSPVIGLTYFIQCLTIIPWKGDAMR